MQQTCNKHVQSESRDSCVLNKKVKFDTVTHHLHSLLELVHVNIWGPTKTASLGGHRYFVSIVDDYFRHCWVYPMRQRVKVLNLLVKWKKLMKNQTGMKIKVLWYNHVEEYKDSFLQFG